ncbi:hypothetical protein QAD02_021028 [Eretmocerus hayati]|uniref:Uncharacterized protein n=1 Tax=Eretmocerus hayati TaxID=131215 RepID=A0ACC2PP99_9HYME|nr:hypothetical protein QAD02_021028 [Eretmocerus hayati]
MPSTFKSRYKRKWENDPLYSEWVGEVQDNTNAFFCKACNQSKSLSNMGKRSLESHAASTSHKESLNSMRKTPTLQSFFTRTSSSAVAPMSANSQMMIHDVDSGKSSSALALSPPLVINHTIAASIMPSSFNQQMTLNTAAHAMTTGPNCTPLSACSSGNMPKENSSSSKKMDAFLPKDQVTRAEIIWSIETVMTHKSLRVAEEDIMAMKKMSENTNDLVHQLQLGRTKIGYFIQYGIAPFFQSDLEKSIDLCEFFSLGFDESLNKVAKKSQMDVNVRRWNDETNEAETRYLTSCFLGRTRACDLLVSFDKAVAHLNIKKKCLEVEMDGPNVNWKFFGELQSECPNLLEMGSCGLHVVHGAYKDGVNSTGWDIVQYLRCLYYLFKDYPARRAIFIQYSGSETFPKKFCGMRWLENITVIERAIEIDASVKKYVSGVVTAKTEPKCKSYKVVKKTSADPLLLAKLSFIKSLASEVEPFLREFQSDDPLVPFLHTTLTKTIANIMGRFMTKKSMRSLESVKISDIKDVKNHLPLDELHLGFGTLKQLSKIKLNKEQSDSFRTSCRTSMIFYISKLITRSPLSYDLTCAATCLDPKIISGNPNLAQERLKKLLFILVSKEHVLDSMADKVMREFSEMISLPTMIESCKVYERSEQRLDHFWRDLAIYDHVKSKGGLKDFEVTKPLILSARNASSRYKEALKSQKVKKVEEDDKKEKKRLLESRIKMLENEKKRFCLKLDEEIQELKKK